jgi:hypothetical protein
MKENQIKDLEWQLSFISDKDFDLLFFINSVIKYRVENFNESKKEIVENLRWELEQEKYK